MKTFENQWQCDYIIITASPFSISLRRHVGVSYNSPDGLNMFSNVYNRAVAEKRGKLRSRFLF